jgi:hypothetical protein
MHRAFDRRDRTLCVPGSKERHAARVAHMRVVIVEINVHPRAAEDRESSGCSNEKLEK